MLFGFLDYHTLLLIAHVFGAIIGAGGAFASDGIFFNTIKDGRITKDEMRFLALGSTMVWAGLALLTVSGVLLVMTDPQGYLSSTKFLVKLSIVGVIIANGIIFHLFHIPRLREHINARFADSPEFMRKAPWLLASGALSMISWIATVALGVIRHIPHEYELLMGIYAGVVFFGVLVSIVFKKRILHLA